jgi:3-mercaptopyruvate sulfurtransferase SseA
MQTMKRVLLLILAAIVLGFGTNSLRSHPLPLRYVKPGTRPSATTPMPTAEPLLISLQDLRDAPKESVIVIDARSALFFKLGHIPRAINVSRKEFARDFAREQAALRKRTASRLVVYCSDEDCEDALLVARDLIRAGLKQVHIFHGGWKKWQEAGLPEEQV